MKQQLFSSIRSLWTISIYILLFLISTSSFSQLAPPQGINYQAIARDTDGKPIANKNLQVLFSILNDTIGGSSPIFTESHPSVVTNRYGLFTVVIGSLNSSGFGSIPWGVGEKYLKVELANGGGYSTIGINQLLSVPYALYAKNSENSWNLNGNNVMDTLFIGTRNAKDFIVKTDNKERIRLKSDGKTGIGTSNPSSFLDVKDSTDLVNGAPVATIRNAAASNGSILELTAFPGGDPATNDKLTGLIINAPTGRFIQGYANPSTKVFEVGLGGKGYFADSVGIGTTTPAAKLDVNGQVRISGGSPGAGKVLTSDAAGLASWATPVSGVSSFSSNDLSPLFTTSTVTSTTTSALTFTLTDAGAFTVFGNNTIGTAAPAYFQPTLASPLFQNQGTSSQVLHGNASGSPTWGGVSLTSDVSGILPLANGGTNTGTIGVSGAIPYSNGSSYMFSTAGASRQVLRSNGAASPSWGYTVDTIKANNGVVATLTSGTGITYTLSGVNNSASSPGVVAAGGISQANKVWKADAAGNPGWRADSSAVYTSGTGILITGTTISAVNNSASSAGIVAAAGVSQADKVWKVDAAGNPGWKADSSAVYTSGTGISITGNTINSAWTQSGNDIYNNNSDSVGIGTSTPDAKLHVMSTGALGNAGIFEITDPTNIDDALSVITDGNGDAIHAETTGAGTAGFFLNNNTVNASNALYVETIGTNDALYAITKGAGGAGKFEIISLTNSNPAVNGETAGNGPAVSGTTSGAGAAGSFQISNPINSSAAITASTAGTGGAASFISTNFISTADVVNISAFGNNSKALNITHAGSGLTNDYGIVVSNFGGGAINTASSFFASGATTNLAGEFSVASSGTANNIAARFTASGGTNNYAAIFAAGNVGIGLTAPSASSSLHAADQIQIGIPLGGQGGAGARDGSLLFHNIATTQTATIKSDSTTASYILYLPKAQGSTNSLLLNDGLGGLSWLSTSSLGAWGLNGNPNTIPSTAPIGTLIPVTQNYIGTIDSKALVMATNSLERMRITTGGNIGIGVLTPASLFHVASSTTALGVSTFEQASADADAYDLNFRKARGTVVAPTVITTADELGMINFKGYSGAGGYVTGAAIKAVSEGTIATTRVPANLSFWTGTDAAPTVLTERMRIDKTGNVGIGTATPVSNARLAIKDGHLQSQQTTAPSVGPVIGGYSGNLSNATDIAGNIFIFPSLAAGAVSFIFNKSYSVAPIVSISPTNSDAADAVIKAYVVSTATGFTVFFGAAPLSTSVHTFSYHVIETQ